ncbi:hypothetical protein ACFY5A_12425 [Microbacterium sp. NPDC012755]|uniref:hypothetical protein n=1 Tax=Microbacterium sp. NPDC012755 TaxID=3364184 RepID=UPI00367924AF
MSTVAVDAPVVSTMPRWWLRRRFVLLMSVLVLPAALAALLNSYGALTEESAMRMAFATVAGQTVAMLGALAAVVLTIVQRRRGLVLFVLIGFVVIVNAVAAMGSAGELLLSRLDLMAETAALN